MTLSTEAYQALVKKSEMNTPEGEAARSKLRSLNVYQRFIADGMSLGIEEDIVELIAILRMSSFVGFDPFYVHLDGDAGVGKSHAPKVLNQICGHRMVGDAVLKFFNTPVGTSSTPVLSPDWRLYEDNICWLLDDQTLKEGSIMANFFLQATNHCTGENYNQNWTFTHTTAHKTTILGKNLRACFTYVDLPPALQNAGMGRRTLRGRVPRVELADATSNQVHFTDIAPAEMVERWDNFWAAQIPHPRTDFTFPPELGDKTRVPACGEVARVAQWLEVAACRALFDGRTTVEASDLDFADGFFARHMPIWNDEVLAEFVPNTPDYEVVLHIIERGCTRFDTVVAETLRWLKEDMAGTKLSRGIGERKKREVTRICKLLLATGYLRR